MAARMSMVNAFGLDWAICSWRLNSAATSAYATSSGISARTSRTLRSSSVVTALVSP